MEDRVVEWWLSPIGPRQILSWGLWLYNSSQIFPGDIGVNHLWFGFRNKVGSGELSSVDVGKADGESGGFDV